MGKAPEIAELGRQALATPMQAVPERITAATVKSTVFISPADTQAYAFRSEAPRLDPESSLDLQPPKAPKEPL